VSLNSFISPVGLSFSSSTVFALLTQSRNENQAAPSFALMAVVRLRFQDTGLLTSALVG
jgi:hypothetical protein